MVKISSVSSYAGTLAMYWAAEGTAGFRLRLPTEEMVRCHVHRDLVKMDKEGRLKVDLPQGVFKAVVAKLFGLPVTKLASLKGVVKNIPEGFKLAPLGNNRVRLLLSVDFVRPRSKYIALDLPTSGFQAAVRKALSAAK
jgi:hypothetical protein